MFAQLALDWLRAEKEHNPDDWENRPFDRGAITVAIDRVYQVITGDIAWRDASPGDRAIWKSRIADVPMFERAWRRDGKPKPPLVGSDPDNAFAELIRLARTSQGRPFDDDPMNQVTPRRRPGSVGRIEQGRSYRWWHFYDTWPDCTKAEPLSGGGPQLVKDLFINANVGMRFLTNLERAGLNLEQRFVITCVSATLSSIEALAWASDRVRVEFSMGSNPALPPLLVRDLFRGVELASAKRRPIILVPRQNLFVRVYVKEPPPADLPPFDLVVDVEGMLVIEG